MYQQASNQKFENLVFWASSLLKLSMKSKLGPQYQPFVVLETRRIGQNSKFYIWKFEVVFLKTSPGQLLLRNFGSYTQLPFIRKIDVEPMQMFFLAKIIFENF